MSFVDHSNTMVLLIGASTYSEDTTITSVPNIKANIEHFEKCLINPDIIGIPKANIIISLNENKNQIERKLSHLAKITRNQKYTILIYYSGHGIISSEDYKLYLTTSQTTKLYLESDGINIDNFKWYIKQSFAVRKIIILDCCHSGFIIDSLSIVPSKIQAEINKFEGTYVMTSAAADTPSLFPAESPNSPTYFTGKLLEILEDGIENNNEYCSLRDIFNEIKTDFSQRSLPEPQQSNFNSADQIYLSRNKKFIEIKPEDELAWEKAANKNGVWDYIDFKEQFPQSQFVKEAKKRISAIEEDIWKKATEWNTISAFDNYKENFPNGKYINEANNKLKDFKERAKIKEEREKEEALLRSIHERHLEKETNKNNNTDISKTYTNKSKHFRQFKYPNTKLILSIVIAGIGLLYYLFMLLNNDNPNSLNKDTNNKIPQNIDLTLPPLKKADSLFDYKKYAEVSKIYLKYSNELNGIQCNRLGIMFQNGHGVPRNNIEALKWYKKAAAKNEAVAMFNIGYLYDHGNEGIPKSEKVAIQWYTKAINGYLKAANEGNSTAMTSIGRMYHYGNGVTQNYSKALNWYRKAAANGEVTAMTFLGYMYKNKQGVSQNYTEAMSWYMKASNEGDLAAINNIGSMYYNGQGVTQSYAEAFQWYRKAADKGDSGAMNSIGYMYEYGQGLSQNYIEAMKWYKKAANNGNVSALYNIGSLYELGKGVPANKIVAIEWYQKAAIKGEPNSIIALKRITKKKY